MANPQLENGYTKIANELLEALCRIRISGEARQVLDAILRKTYGFNKIEDRVALSQICLLTGLKKQVVCRSLNKLSSMNLVIKKDTDLGNVYRFNKDFDQWKPLSKKITVLNIDNAGVLNNVKGGYSKKRHTKETNTKDNTTKERADKSASKVTFNPLGGEVLKAFEVVDPKNKTYYNNTTQRKACDYLISEYGLDEVLKRILVLPKTNKQPFFPKVNSPNDLKEKWVNLNDSVERYRTEKKKITKSTPNYIL